ncbi:MAG: hypothetical protein RMH75_04845 [Archaeoglobaceae archaeon]|nr:hypothetical protein [Archaeoglobaceae archaeon]MDW7989973.1 hypothetical protein [Archaeoglobaceae archaeon]
MKTGKILELNNKIAILLQTEPRASENLLERFGKVSYDEKSGNFLIEVERDCRLEISKFLFENGYIVKEIHLKEPSLEEVYFILVRD